MSLPPLPTKAPISSAFIPPPPLPEHYLPNQKEKGKFESDSSTASDATITHTQVRTTEQVKRSKINLGTTDEERYIAPSHLPPVFGNATDEFCLAEGAAKMWSCVSREEKNVPPLAIYHICRICMRPRSARYHREHPIPLNGVPPPPGICRRCRIVKVEEDVIKVKTAKKIEDGYPDLILRRESNDIRFGVASLVPEDDYIGSQEMKERRDKRLLRERKQSSYQEESDETDEIVGKKEIVYRHVKGSDRRVSLNPKAAAVPAGLQLCSTPLPSQPRSNITSTGQDPIDTSSIRSQEHVMTSVAATKTLTQSPPAEAKRRSSISRNTEGAKFMNVTGIETFASASSTPRRLYSKRSTMAYGEKDIWHVSDESDIRRIAREEVERYRQAERKLEAHPDPYAHGRLVPIERVIKMEQNRADSRPWEARAEEAEAREVERLAYTTRQSPRANIAQGKDRPLKLAESNFVRYKSQELDVSMPCSRPPKTPQIEAEHSAKCEDTSWPDSYSQVNTRDTNKGKVSEGPEKHDSINESKASRKSLAEAQGSKVTEARRMRSEKISSNDLYTVPARSVDTRMKRALSQVPKSNIAEPRSTCSENRSWDNIDSISKTANHRGMKPQVGTKSGDAFSPDGVLHQRNVEKDGGTRFRCTLTDVEEDVEFPLDLERSKFMSQTDCRLSNGSQKWREDCERQDLVDEATYSFSKSKPMTSQLSTASKHWQEDIGLKAMSNHSSHLPDEVPVYHKESKTNGRVLSRFPKSDRTASSGENDNFEVSFASADKGLHSQSRYSDGSGVTNKSRYNGEKCRLRENDNLEPIASSEYRVLDPQSSTGSERQLKEKEQEEHDVDGEPDLISSLRSFAPFAARTSGRLGNTALEGLPNDDWQDVRFSKYRKSLAQPFSARSGSSAPDGEYIHIERIIRPADDTSDKREYNDIPEEYRREAEEYLNWSHHAEIVADRFSPPLKQEQSGEKLQRARVSPSEGSTRVRFASKIDVSPTPPGSDASSTQFRNIGGRVGTKQRIREPAESAEDVIAEYERRGRAREREWRRGRPKKEADQPEYFDGPTEIVPQDQANNGEKQPKTARDSNVRYQPRRSQPIVKALSESPSRERLSDAKRSRHGDSAGPYRPEEPRRESMEVHDGSSHGRRIERFEETYSG